MQEHSVSGRARGILVAVAAGCVAVNPVLASSQQRVAPQRPVTIMNGAIGATDRGRSERVTLPDGPVGWEIVLEIADPRAVDLDLYVYSTTERLRGRPICASEGVEAVEVCRILPVPPGSVTIDVSASGGSGRSDFRVTRRALTGARMGDTPAVAGDAIDLVPGEWRTGSVSEAPFDYSNASDNSGVLFRLDTRGHPRRVIAVSSSVGDAFEITAFDVSGRLLGKEGDPDATGYVDLTVEGRSDAATLFVLVTSLDGSDRFSIGTWPLDEPMPVPVATESWSVSGSLTRAFTLVLDQGETAAVELEGTRALLVVTDVDGRALAARPQFGTAQQLAQVGDPVGNSAFVLAGAGQRRPVALRVNVEGMSPYDKPATWRMHVHRTKGPQNYRIRFGSAVADEWRDWWTSPVASRSDQAPTDGLRLIQLLPPGDARPNLAQSTRQLRVTPQGTYLARLAGIPGHHLAVCTIDGQVLDISSEVVRWEWRPGLNEVFLVVFPDPFATRSPGGEFRLEVTRSISERKY